MLEIAKGPLQVKALYESRHGYVRLYPTLANVSRPVNRHKKVFSSRYRSLTNAAEAFEEFEQSRTVAGCGAVEATGANEPELIGERKSKGG